MDTNCWTEAAEKLIALALQVETLPAALVDAASETKSECALPFRKIRGMPPCQGTKSNKRLLKELSLFLAQRLRDGMVVEDVILDRLISKTNVDTTKTVADKMFYIVTNMFV